MEEIDNFDPLDELVREFMAEFPDPPADPDVEFYSDEISPETLDELLSNGWRHFGVRFFRYDTAVYKGKRRNVVPLRLDLSRFSFSKSQRRTLNRNIDLAVVTRPIKVTPEAKALFERHKRRFVENAPSSIYDYVWIIHPESTPCPAFEVSVYEGKKLVAASYFDLGKTSVSSIYGMFEPDLHRRRLGIFTILKEIEFAIENGRRYYYLGYVYDCDSFYDYKKRFRATEMFDWNSAWKSFGD